MTKRSKMDGVYDELKKPESEPKEDKEKMVTTCFNLGTEDVRKLKQYAKDVAPSHIKVSLSEFIRYLIGSCDIEKAKKEFFKV